MWSVVLRRKPPFEQRNGFADRRHPTTPFRATNRYALVLKPSQREGMLTCE
jgi:hypothetical protein